MVKPISPRKAALLAEKLGVEEHELPAVLDAAVAERQAALAEAGATTEADT